MNAATYEVVRLANGTRSIRALEVGETFHPVIGPAAEAEALYVRPLRLADRLAEGAGECVVWDVGLGAAANALTVFRATRYCAGPVRMISFDHTLEPLRFARVHAAELGYFTGYEDLVGRLLEAPAAGLEETDGAHRIRWEAHLGDFPGMLRDASPGAWPAPHAVMFDAFSPATNPDMWTLPLFRRLFARLDPDRPCLLSTYSRSTLLRVTLLRAGFFVGAGGATGEKEETTVASNRIEWLDAPLEAGWLDRARRSTSAEPLHEPVYRQQRLTAETWELLQQHPQFRIGRGRGPGV